MTVTEGHNFETHDLASHSRFFPARIHVPHHQLRNFISTAYKSQVFFVQNYDIFVLDLVSNQRSLVATVPFEARCLAAAHGWVCVGGEMKGDCAFVRVGESEDAAGKIGLELVVDMLGKEIVNSMTIHKIAARRVGQQDEIVVLISNNDRTVTLYSLSQQAILSVLDHPVAMNYASMSPDCTVIAAVGDSDEVFFYRRRDPQEGYDKRSKSNDYAAYNWILIKTPRVPSGRGVREDYSFAAAFSPNGRLCAVSARGGYITVLDMVSLITGDRRPEAAILCSFKSSRSSLWGCVRSMSFSPEPWDLLAWTEDHGRIGVADVRQSFSRRQRISLDQKASTSILVEDLTPLEFGSLDVKERLKQQHLQRVRRSRGLVPVGARSFEDVRGSQFARESLLMDQTMDLDRHEQSVLEALETTMDDIEAHSVSPYNVNYPSSSGTAPPAAESTDRQYDVQLLNPGARSGAVLHTPRRTNSIVLPRSGTARRASPAENPRNLITESPAPMSDDSSTPPMSTNNLTPSNNPSSSQPLPYNIPASDPWHVIEAALGTSRDAHVRRSDVIQEHASSLTNLESSINAEHRLANSLELQLADERRLSALLRAELEARERLLEARQQQAQASHTLRSRLSPSLERVLQRQLQLEVENGRQRSAELESEIQRNSQRLERLSHARNSLEEYSRRSEDIGTVGVTRSTEVLPDNSTDTELHDLDSTLLHLEEERRVRQQRIQDLGTQVRRAESRVELASVRNSIQRAEQRDRHHERLLEAQFLHAARGGTTLSSLGNAWQLRDDNPEAGSSVSGTVPSSQPQTAASRLRGAAIRRAEAAVVAERTSRAPVSELAGSVSESEMQLARIMLQRASVDGNGNWVAGQEFRRLFGGIRSSDAPNAHLQRVPMENRSTEDLMSDGGLGTAGVGWSPDGRFLYVGSEAGIFEFTVHTRDRMCFPSVEFR